MLMFRDTPLTHCHRPKLSSVTEANRPRRDAR